jgi:hypothetical protein
VCCCVRVISAPLPAYAFRARHRSLQRKTRRRTDVLASNPALARGQLGQGTLESHCFLLIVRGVGRFPSLARLTVFSAIMHRAFAGSDLIPFSELPQSDTPELATVTLCAAALLCEIEVRTFKDSIV